MLKGLLNKVIKAAKVVKDHVVKYVAFVKEIACTKFDVNSKLVVKNNMVVGIKMVPKIQRPFIKMYLLLIKIWMLLFSPIYYVVGHIMVSRLTKDLNMVAADMHQEFVNGFTASLSTYTDNVDM